MLFLESYDANNITKKKWEKDFKNHITKLHFVLRMVTKYIDEIRDQMPKIRPKKRTPVPEDLFPREVGEMHQKAKTWTLYVDYDFDNNEFVYPDEEYISDRIKNYAHMLFLEDICYSEMALIALECFEKDTIGVDL